MKGIKFNWFAQIHLVLESKFGHDPLSLCRVMLDTDLI